MFASGADATRDSPLFIIPIGGSAGRGAKIDNPSGLMTARLASALRPRGGLASARACKIKRRLLTGTTANAAAIAAAATMNDLRVNPLAACISISGTAERHVLFATSLGHRE